LAEALDQLPDDVREYKRTAELTDAAVQWLTSAAESPTSTDDAAETHNP
jgi:hypothetical protein